ncbi:uncharacterized protein UMAG_11375 [Mycosarcoma maydis]|uniref:Uncharacterized protein n=1 Tax=Mycosarcoma maydis TaxID=5270 RepID=A0A0D1CCA0_MYCMD|nr:uncharacterized protein UMAG_11375 [Ustilago maydis 521]KIS70812.1 hypothetical protein UMAG_11375 [Ustilago maydis 521]|eukprot:XP_011388034.1 hypothetical protein UMAG_11375 [Ustilago maydis 521]
MPERLLAGAQVEKAAASAAGHVDDETEGEGLESKAAKLHALRVASRAPRRRDWVERRVRQVAAVNG